MNIDILDFKEYCLSRRWIFDEFTSEFTFQFRLCRFIEDSHQDYSIELESNIERYGLSNLAKKEIDIDILERNFNKTAIEVKYIRDFGSHNIGMFNYCEDIKFLEEIVGNVFNNGIAIIFTTIENLYTEPKKSLKPKNIENLALYNAFRINRLLAGELKIKTGKMDRSLVLNGQYNLNWVHFSDTIKACIVNVV
jgi:hypothetical protein